MRGKPDANLSAFHQIDKTNSSNAVFSRGTVLTTKPCFDLKRIYCASIRGLVMRIMALGKAYINAIHQLKEMN